MKYKALLIAAILLFGFNYNINAQNEAGSANQIASRFAITPFVYSQTINLLTVSTNTIATPKGNFVPVRSFYVIEGTSGITNQPTFSIGTTGALADIVAASNFATNGVANDVNLLTQASNAGIIPAGSNLVVTVVTAATGATNAKARVYVEGYFK